MPSHIKTARLVAIPEQMRAELISSRHARGWSQAELGRRVGLPQVHISAIETGRVVPRFNTLLDLVRILGLDLLLIPRALVPTVHALVRDFTHPRRQDDDGERSLYATDEVSDGEES